MHTSLIRLSSLGLLLLTALPAHAQPPAADGAAVYAESCARCHNGGLTGMMYRAPRIGSGYWAERERVVGSDQLVAHTLDGFGRMAAQGGPEGITEAQARAAVEYMLRATKP